MTVDERDCANPYLKAANREYKLMSGGQSLFDDTITISPKKPLPPKRTLFTHYFLNPFLKAANKAHALHTGYSLLAMENTAPLQGGAAVGRRLRKYDPRVLHRARKRYLNRVFRLSPKVRKVLPWGALSLFLYSLLFINEQAIMQASSSGHWWSFMVPVCIALVFSLAHGNFTAAFWDAVGLKPNTVRK